MQLIPLIATAKQNLEISLGGQDCVINVYQLRTGLFVDLVADGKDIVTAAIGQDRNRIVRSVYLGFIGDLTFIDSSGTDDPDYTGLATRFEFFYLTAEDLVTLGLIG